METDSTYQTRAAQDGSERNKPNAARVEYVGMRVDGTPVVLKLTEHTRLSPTRSLELVRHSPAGFEWGYIGSGPAQLACALLLDYYDDETVAQQHYIQFRDEVVSRLGAMDRRTVGISPVTTSRPHSLSSRTTTYSHRMAGNRRRRCRRTGVS